MPSISISNSILWKAVLGLTVPNSNKCKKGTENDVNAFLNLAQQKHTLAISMPPSIATTYSEDPSWHRDRQELGNQGEFSGTDVVERIATSAVGIAESESPISRSIVEFGG